jgi:glucan phosphoethanolaminetransferase (alkaline phosphatase superfamily)
VFDQINGLPVHALVIHAAVVFVPLLAVGAIAYALVARWRPRIGWAVLLLAVAAPASAFVATQSGNALRDRLIEQGVSGRGAEIIDDHMGYGQLTLWFTLALGVVSLVLVLATMRRAGSLPKVADIGLAVVTVVLAAISGYYVFQTGDSGATAVWGTY